MYKTFYGLRDKPFALLPDTGFLYLGATHRTAYSLLEYGLISEAPFMVLTGDPGMGKTSLLQKVIAEHRAAYSIGLVTNARYDVNHLLPWILLALGLSHKQLDPVEAHHTFTEFLSREAERNRRVVLIVDEAQTLGVNLLEELRLMSNMNQEKTLQLQIILSGQPDLHRLLQRPDMTQFAQRIVVDYHLQPFSQKDVLHYIRHRLCVAGGRPSLFTEEACNLTHRLSRGNPRLINQVCEMALTYGFARQAPRVTAKLLAQAALDRKKNKILPLAEEEDLSSIVNGPEEIQEAEEMEENVSASLPMLGRAPSDKEPEALSASETFYQSGLALKKNREYEAAIKQFEHAATDPSYHLKSFSQIGLCYKAIGRLGEAVSAFRKTFADQYASRQQSLTVRYLLGRTLEHMDEVDEAQEQYRKICRVDRTFKDAAIRLSRLEEFAPSGSMPASFLPSAVGRAWRQVRQLLKGSS
jgi:type II secretory pathway predicted ATPase ExeA